MKSPVSENSCRPPKDYLAPLGGDSLAPASPHQENSKSTPRKRPETTLFAAGGYRYVPSVFQYSAGVVAAPGFDMVRVRFRRSPPLLEGFVHIEKFLADRGRPLSASAPANYARSGLTWHFSRPPVVGLEFEMDCRGIGREILL
jgi:hypothetical protein